MSRPSLHSLEQVQRDLECMDILEEAGVDPAMYAAARMSEVPGFELPHLVQQQLLAQALINKVREKHYQPPAVDPERDLIFGELFEQ